MLCEKVACAAISPQLNTLWYILVQCYPLLWQLYSDFKDFNNGIYVKKIAITESNFDTEVSLQQVALAPTVWPEPIRCRYWKWQATYTIVVYEAKYGTLDFHTFLQLFFRTWKIYATMWSMHCVCVLNASTNEHAFMSTPWWGCMRRLSTWHWRYSTLRFPPNELLNRKRLLTAVYEQKVWH